MIRLGVAEVCSTLHLYRPLLRPIPVQVSFSVISSVHFNDVCSCVHVICHYWRTSVVLLLLNIIPPSSLSYNERADKSNLLSYMLLTGDKDESTFLNLSVVAFIFFPSQCRTDRGTDSNQNLIAVLILLHSKLRKSLTLLIGKRATRGGSKESCKISGLL